jgi:hypothetical protein
MSKKSLVQRLILSLVLFSLGSSAFAQDNGGGDVFEQSMSDIITVSALGGVGAILGLSTLSFVDEPKDHLKNIVVGGALGIIIGVGVVAFSQANKSRDSYQGAYINHPDFSTNNRLAWHKTTHRSLSTNIKSSAGKFANFNFEF